jgi:hypothetical protein
MTGTRRHARLNWDLGGDRFGDAARRAVRAAAVVGFAATAGLTMAAGASAAPAATPSWRIDLDAGTADQHNTGHTAGGLTLRDTRTDHRQPGAAGLAPLVAQGPAGGRGSYVAPEVSTDLWVSAVQMDAAISQPAGAAVAIDVRGRDVHGEWTQWREVSPGKAVALPQPVSKLQARVNLQASATGLAPTVSSVELRSAAAPAESAAAPAAALAPSTYRLYGTREGLVGGRTANGHVIASRDHFVALPSRRMLAANGGDEYKVKVCYNGRCETAPVWDVGPWNTHDDYWSPSGVREKFKDLPQGTPEAQAASQNGYNSGEDESGRRVTNPAGIDLGDGTFWDGLGMTGSGWVDVTFNPTSGGGQQVTAWAQANVRSCEHVSCAVVSQVYAQQTYPATCWTIGDKITAEGFTNDKWIKLPLAAGGAGYVSAIYLTGNETGGVTTRC